MLGLTARELHAQGDILENHTKAIERINSTLEAMNSGHAQTYHELHALVAAHVPRMRTAADVHAECIYQEERSNQSDVESRYLREKRDGKA